MILISLDGVEFERHWALNDERINFEVANLLSAGANQATVLYWAIKPGCQIGLHTASAEEVLLVLSGVVVVRTAHEAIPVAAGQLVCLPQLTAHEVHNEGESEARCLGFLPTGQVAVSYATPLQPWDLQFFNTADWSTGQPVRGVDKSAPD